MKNRFLKFADDIYISYFGYKKFSIEKCNMTLLNYAIYIRGTKQDNFLMKKFIQNVREHLFYEKVKERNKYLP